MGATKQFYHELLERRARDPKYKDWTVEQLKKEEEEYYYEKLKDEKIHSENQTSNQ